MATLPCELAGGFAQVRVTSESEAGRSRRATLLVGNGCVSGYMGESVCFAIFSCFAQQEIWVFGVRLFVAVFGWTPLW